MDMLGSSFMVNSHGHCGGKKEKSTQKSYAHRWVSVALIEYWHLNCRLVKKHTTVRSQ